MKRLLMGLIISLVAGAVFAQKFPDGGTIVIAYYDEPTDLNPLVSANGSAALIESFFTNGLVKQNDVGEVVPDIAEKWDISKDELTWTFTLRKGLRFSDGSELTADDVLFTYVTALDPRYQNPTSPLSTIVQSYKVPSKSTFQIILKAPYGRLPQLCGKPIVPARLLEGGAAAEKAFNMHPVGSGPYKLTEWKTGQLTFDANLNYYEGRPHLDRIVFKLFSDPKKAWTSLMQGETDIVVDVDNEDYSVIKDDPRFKAYAYLDGFCLPLLFNLKDPLFSQIKIRQAISAAIDRKDLIDKALQGGGVATTGPFQPGTWPYDPDPTLQAYDPAKAAKLLADQGWKDTNGDWILDKGGKKLQFSTLINQGDKLKEDAAKRIQWQLLQAGIRMDVESVPFEAFIQRLLAGKFQAAIVELTNSADPDVTATAFWHSSSIGGYNIARYSSPELDRLISLGKVSSDSDARKLIYRNIHRQIATDAPAAFLYFKKRYTATTARLHGFESATASFFIGLRNWYLTEDPKEERR